MKLRFYAALVTATLAMVLTTMALWLFTDMSLGGILFTQLIVYMAAVGGTLIATEPAHRPHRPDKPQITARRDPEASQEICESLEDPPRIQIITLNRDEWESGKAGRKTAKR